MAAPILLAVPNVPEGRSADLLARLAAAFKGPPAAERVALLDTHSDPDHHRSVFTLAGSPAALVDAIVNGAEAARDSIDLSRRDLSDPASAGRHPHVGVLDVAPFVYLEQSDRGAACAAALLAAERVGGELGIPVFLYGELTADEHTHARTRAELRRGGLRNLTGRMARGELAPDFGPSRPHPTAGATLIAARPPLVAFNLQLAPQASEADAKRAAATIREGGPDGIEGLRAIAVQLTGPVQQVSLNVERPRETPLAMIVERLRRLVPLQSAELVGLAPRAAFDGFPQDLPIPGFDPSRHLIENALAAAALPDR